MPNPAPRSRSRKAAPATVRLHTRLAAILARCADAGRCAAARILTAAAALRPIGRVRVEILCTNERRRKALSRAIRSGLRQLRRSVAGAPRLTAIVVSEHVAASGRQLAGSAYVRRDASGRQSALLRLALSVDGRSLSDDEVLAVLAEQWIGLSVEQGAPCVLIPTELPLGSGAAARHDLDDRGPADRTLERRDDPLAAFLGPAVSAAASGADGSGRAAHDHRGGTAA